MTSQEVQRTPQQQAVAQIRSAEFAEQLAAALPEGISVERFARFAHTALLDDAARQTDPAKRLTAAEPASLYQALIKCAQDGLMPDGREAALVKRGTKVAYQPMIGGFRKVAAQHGWTIRSAAVRKEDDFDYTDEPPSLFHKVSPGADRGELVYAYAVARHTDGRREQCVMTREQVLKRAKVATTDKIWDAWPDEMWAKTPARDLFGELPMDPADALRLARLIEADRANPVEALYGPTDSAVAHSADSQPPEEKEEAGHSADDSSAAGANDEPGLSEDATDLSAADEAAAYVPPNGKFAERGQHGPKTLGEILELGDDGAGWFRWALAQSNLGGTDHPEYKEAVWVFAEAYAPALHAEAAAKRDLS